MYKPVTVGQAMTRKFECIDLARTVNQALQLLKEKGAEFCVVVTGSLEPSTILTAEQLENFSAKDQSLATLKAEMPTAIVVPSNHTMDLVVSALGDCLSQDPRIPGIVVVDDKTIAGVVPREIVAAHKVTFENSAVRRGANLAGDPVTSARVYECPLKDYQTTVVIYNRFDPPRCPNDNTVLIRKR